MKGKYKCNAITLAEFYNSAKQLHKIFVDVTIEHVYKGDNNEANKLAQHVFGYRKVNDEALESSIEEYCIMKIELVDPW